MSPTTHGKRRLRVHQLFQALGQLLARLGPKDTCRRQDLRVGPEVLRLVFVDKRLLGEDRVGQRVVQGLAALSIGLANRQGQREDKGRETHIPDVSSVFTGAVKGEGRREKGKRSGKDQNKSSPCIVRQSPYRLTTQCRTTGQVSESIVHAAEHWGKAFGRAKWAPENVVMHGSPHRQSQIGLISGTRPNSAMDLPMTVSIKS